MAKPALVSLSSGGIIKVLFILLLLGFLWIIRDIIALLFVALIFSAALYPAVTWFKKRRVPPWAAVLLLYVLIIGVFSLAIGLLVPVFADQVVTLINDFPEYYSRFGKIIEEIQRYSAQYNLQDQVQQLLGPLGKAGQGIVTSVFGIFGGFVSILLVLVLTFYMLAEEEGLEHFIRILTPRQHHAYALELLARMRARIGLWLRGQLILMIVVGILVFIGLLILRVPYAAILAFLAFLLEIVPVAGPIFAGIIAAILTFLATGSLFLTGFVVALFIIVQQIENQILVPKVMKKVVGLNPIVVIVALLVGAKIGGVVGALIAVPVVTALSVAFHDWHELRRSDA